MDGGRVWVCMVWRRGMVGMGDCIFSPSFPSIWYGEGNGSEGKEGGGEGVNGGE